MSRVITFSRTFPSYHPKAGQPTYFVEKIWKSLCGVSNEYTNPFMTDDYKKSIVWGYQLVEGIKHHTIRAGHRFKVGDKFSPCVWGDDVNPKSGKKGPYNSKMIKFAPDIEVKKMWGFDLINSKVIIGGLFHCYVNQHEKIEAFALNDGLDKDDLLSWFKHPNSCIDNQIICWNENINY